MCPPRSNPHPASTNYFNPPLPRILAHRGFAEAAPENTILAFSHALIHGAGYLELDVHASADQIAVVSHDPTLPRPTGPAIEIARTPWSELRTIPLAHGQTLCTLSEVLDTFPEARINIDLKTPAAVAPTVAAIRKARATHRVLISSFDEKSRAGAVRHLPGVATSTARPAATRAIIYATLGLTGPLARTLAPYDAVQLPYRVGGIPIITPRLIRRIQRTHTEVHVWTVNNPTRMAKLLRYGVDGIVTDRCDLAVALTRAHN